MSSDKSNDKAKLPPLPEEVFDGDHQSVTVDMPRCSHKYAIIVKNELRCPCGAAWSGPSILSLYKLLHG